MELKDQIALVTGGASGMGREVCYQLAKQGARVAVLDINEKGAQTVAKDIQGFVLACDIADESSVTQAFQKLEQHWGLMRICVNCAGIISGARVVGKEAPMSLDVFKKVIDVNLTGTFNILRLAAQFMSKLAPLEESGERGVIINTASIAAFEGQVGQAAYSAAKAGIVGMTLPIARELSRFGIRVMAIAPGLIKTPMTEGFSEVLKENLEKNVIFPKRFGEVQEYAKLVLHIIDNVLLNGEVIRLDGAVRLPAV